MITLVLQSSLCWLIFLMIYQLILIKVTFFRFNRIYLISTLMLGLMIPILRILWERISIAPISLSVFSTFQGTAQIFEISSMAETKIEWLLWANNLYWIGVAISLFFLIKQILSILNTIRKYPSKKFEDCTLVSTDYEHLPFSFMGYVFISEKLKFKDEELHRILKHEISHVHGNHSLDVLLVELIKAFAWFSPLVYWYKNNIRNTHEYLADALVLMTSDTQSYGQLLINNSQQGLQMALANHFIYSQLKNRINMMTKSPSSPINRWKYTLILPIILFLGVLFAYKSDHSLKPIDDTLDIMKHNLGDSMPLNGVYILNGERVSLVEINNILPTQIISMNLLKDDKSLKQYGELGKNGVIQINTRPLYFVDGNESTKEAVDKIKPEDISSMDVLKYGKSSIGVVRVTLKKSASSIDANVPLRFSEQMPQFPGGDVALMNFLGRNIKYPASAKKHGIQGRGIYEFIVKTDGSLSDIKVIRGLSDECDEEAMRVLNLMNTEGYTWTPGTNNGTKYPVIFTLPIQFKLDDTKKEISTDVPSSHSIQILQGLIKSDTIPSPILGKVNAIKSIDEVAQFPGGEEKLFQFISDHLRYPLIAKDSGIQGRVVVSFVVEASGSIRDAKILKGIGGGCNEESLRMINSMNTLDVKWIPGKMYGKPVASEYILPLSFKLLGAAPEDQSLSNANEILKSNSSSVPLKIIPNPAKNQIEINWNQSGNLKIEIYDISGRIIHHSNWSDFHGKQIIDVSKYSKGNYIVKVQHGEEMNEQKLILQ